MIRTETGIQECKKFWERFSPGKDTWDDWDLLFAYHDPDRHRFNFLVHESDDGHTDGMIPLVHDMSLNRFMLMGGSYPDGRVLWIQKQDFLEFFEQFPDRTALFDLRGAQAAELLQLFPQLEANFAERDFRYYMVPAEFGYDFNNHLDTFSTEKRQKFHYDLRNIRKREPVLHWSADNEADLFIDLVNRNFGEESDYTSEENASEVRRIVEELERSGRLRTLTIEVEGNKQAVSLSLFNANKMVALYSSSNNDFNNLGKLLNVETIQEACRLRADEISFMTGMQWKANWKMKAEPCITVRKPPAPWPESQG